MKNFPINEKICLLKSYLKKYLNTMSFFGWELKKFRTNKYIIEKIRDFPFHLFGDSDGDIFFNAVANTFFEMCLISAFKLSNDTSKGAYTMKNFRDDIILHFKKRYIKLFHIYLKEIDFDKKLNIIAEKVRNLRNKALTHINESYAKNKLNLQGISWSEFDIIEDNLINAFNGLSFEAEWMLLPISYDPRVKHPKDTDSRPDIVNILDYIAKESYFLNLPENNPTRWQFEVKEISKEDLEVFNYYRKKNNLSTF